MVNEPTATTKEIEIIINAIEFHNNEDNSLTESDLKHELKQLQKEYEEDVAAWNKAQMLGVDSNH